MAPLFGKILIANRGEVAVRVIRACRELGITTVAVFSEADREALHVLMADEAYLIGPPPARASYLATERLIQAAKASGAEAVHPGYGFLAERADFAEACRQAGLTFIGPPPSAITTMGDKTAARRAAVAMGVPVVPGAHEPIGSDAEAERLGRELGYPVMVKAAMGGGGKGMRLVRSEGELASALRMARSESRSAFGDSSVYIERLLDEPRHIEIQVLADRHGTVIHLGERECSIQRRHQKLIEESPSPIVDALMRAKMGAAASKIAAAVGYVNAGTAEFLVDRQKNFYFLEMNTRLQVEHPVTELVTGIDLVKEQIRIAAGEKLGYGQADVTSAGWAIECRIYAEDPYANFMPSPGKIRALRVPAGPWVRNDSGVYEGYTVPVYYDPMISKLIVWGPDRPDAIRRMARALSEYKVTGVRTTIPVLQRLMAHPDFVAGRLSTRFLERWLSAKRPEAAGRHRIVALIAAAAAAYQRAGRIQSSGPASAKPGPWVMSVRRAGWGRKA
ncbi:MAG: acetyl-CoA carboxylase biotin carboxylase subunit [Candidatus Methylomirabilia bacterium]